MKSTMIAALTAATLVACLSKGAAEPRSFKVGSSDRLELDVPKGWSTSFEVGAGGLGTIKLQPPRDVPLVLMITPFAPPDDVEDAPRRARRIAESQLRALQESAVEAELVLRELEGPQCRGHYVSATDRTVDRPTREDFKYIDSGGATAAGLMLIFTVLTNQSDGPERGQALDVVRSARRASPPEVRKRGGLEDAMLARESLPADCDFIDGEHAVSPQARKLYGIKELGEAAGGKVLDRGYQSIRCDGITATLYYYHYASPSEAQRAISFAQALLWGEDGPTTLNPELVRTSYDVLIVLSSRDPEGFLRVLTQRSGSC